MQSPPTVCDNVCQPSNLQSFHCLGFCEDGNCLDGRLLLLIDVSFKPIFLQTLEFLLVNSCTAEKCFSWFCFSSILKRNILSWFLIESSVQCCKEIFSRFVIDFFCGFYAWLSPFRALSFQSSIFCSLIKIKETAIYGIQYTAVFTNIFKDIAMHLYKTPFVGNILALYSPL